MCKFWGDYRGGVAKNGVLEHRSGNISETRTYRGKVTIGAYIGTHQRSFQRHHSRPPIRPLLPRKFARRTPPKTPIAIISGTGKATDFKFGQYIQRVHPNKKSIKNFRESERGRMQGLPIFGYPLLSQERVKLRNSNFACTFIGSIGKKRPLKISAKVAVGILRDRNSRKFPGHPYIGRIARLSLR